MPGAAHGADVVLVFDAMDKLPGSRLLFTRGDRQLAETLHHYWASFVITGDPNGDARPDWPRTSHKESRLLLIGNDGIEARVSFRQPQMNFASQLRQLASGRR